MELNIPFAETGNREDFPINATSDQSLSLEKGYPIPYQLKPEEGGKFILRPQFNQAMYLVSKEVVDWRTQTFPNWSAELAAGLKYKKNSIVKYSDGNVYISNIDNNTSLPTSADWTNFNDFGSININNLTNKTTPEDTDNLVVQQTNGLLKKLSWINLKETLKNYFDTIYNNWVPNDSRAKVALNANGNPPIYAARAWVNFDGTTIPITIRGSGNISSITSIGTGVYQINFITPMPDKNYSFTCNAARGTPLTPLIAGVGINSDYTENLIILRVISDGGAAQNSDCITLTIVK